LNQTIESCTEQAIGSQKIISFQFNCIVNLYQAGEAVATTTQNKLSFILNAFLYDQSISA
jgi:hypothetical protein